MTLYCLYEGLVITEWDAGKQLCAEFLNCEAKSRAFADQLVNIALHFGFDGWLVNIENALQVPYSYIRNLIKYRKVKGEQ